MFKQVEGKRRVTQRPNVQKTLASSDNLIRELTGHSDPECKLSLHISGLWHTFSYVFVRDCCIQHTTRRAPRGQPEQWYDGVQISRISCAKGRIAACEDARAATLRARASLWWKVKQFEVVRD